MSRVPAYPFRVVVTRKPVGDRPPQTENHNYANIAGAIAYRDIALRKSNTKRVEMLIVLDESTPAHST